MFRNRTRSNIKCRNCGHFGHYSDRCAYPQQSKTNVASVKCYTCGQLGHYSDKCTGSIVAIVPTVESIQMNQPVYTIQSTQQSTQQLTPPIQPMQQQAQQIKCFECKQFGHYRDKCPNVKSTGVDALEVLKSSSGTKLQKIRAVIKLDGMWGQNSAYMHTESLFSQLKNQLLLALVNENVITAADIDDRNRVSHVDIKGSKETYDQLNGKVMILDRNSFKVQRNSIVINIDSNVHFTLVFKKDIGLQLAAIVRAIDSVIAKIVETQGSVDQSKLCSICFENEVTMLFQPCNHVSTCATCATNCSSCPNCRSQITNKIKVFISTA